MIVILFLINIPIRQMFVFLYPNKKETMQTKQSNHHLLIALLRLSTFLLFAGRAWQHLFWDAPFRALLWDKDWMEGTVTWLTGDSWQAYVTSETAGHFIDNLIFSFGIFYGTMAILTLVIKPSMKGLAWLYALSSLALGLLAFLYCKEKFYHLGQFFEYVLQFSLPLFFYLALTEKINVLKLKLYLKIPIALTFLAHGLYALGYYPQPGEFIDMVINILHVSETSATYILYLAGVLDMVFAVGIFIPRFAKVSLIYMILWGGATALARTWANFYMDFPLNSLHQNLHETIYRLPHALIPLTVLFMQFPSMFGLFGMKRDSGF